jgi:hypothetical protein
MSNRWRLLPLLAILAGWLGMPQPALADGVTDYFTFDVNTDISKTQVLPGEAFRIVVTARAECINNLPVKVTDCKISGRLVAVNGAGGGRIVLANYEYLLSPFPNNKGETAQTAYTLDAMLPEKSSPGSYDLVAELIDAQIKAIFWISVAPFLPENAKIGCITLLQGTMPVGFTETPLAVNAGTAAAVLTPGPAQSITQTADTPATIGKSAAAKQPLEYSNPEILPTAGTITAAAVETGVNWWMYGSIGEAAVIIGLLLWALRRH